MSNKVGEQSQLDINLMTESSGRLIQEDGIIVNKAETINRLSKTMAVNLRDIAGRDAFVTTFGQLAVSLKDSQITEQFPYGLPDTGIESGVTGSGEIVAENSLLHIRNSSIANGTAFLESLQALRYIPGSMAYAFFTVSGFPIGLNNTSAFAGLFDDEDGFAVGSLNGVFNLLYRRFDDPSTTTIHIPQSELNLDTLDGNGMSQYIVDFTKGQVYAITYGYLGFAPVVFWIKRDNDNWIPFHMIEYPNTSLVTHISQPYIPLRAEIDNTGSGDIIDLGVGSIDAGIFNGGKTDSSSRADGFTLSDLTTVPFTVTSAGDEVIALRGKLTLGGRKNKISVLFNTISFGSDDSIKGITLEVIKNPTETLAGTWTELSSASPIEFSLDAEYDLTTGFKTGIGFTIPKDFSVSEQLADITNTLIRRGEVVLIKARANQAAGGHLSDLIVGLKDLL